MANREKLLLIIDGSNLAHRAFQKFEKLTSRKGVKTGLIYGFLRLLQGYIIRFHPTHLIITFDTKQSKDSNFKNKLLGSYKKHREKNISIDYEDFNRQMRVLRTILKNLNIPCVVDLKGMGHESDDYIAIISRKHTGKVLIISSDKDFCQLIDERVKIFNPFKEAIINTKTCMEIMGYTPSECSDYLCLVGDKSDDIPGYKGIGPKKARDFLNQFHSIEEFLNSDNEYRGIDKEGLEDLYGRNKILINFEEGQKRYPIKEIPFKLSKTKEVNNDKLKRLFVKYTLHSFMRREFVKPFEELKLWKGISE